MSLGFKDKTVFVTGSGGGLGRAIAQAFAAEGAFVICTDINERAGAETVAALGKAGGKGRFYQADISDEDQVKALFRALRSDHDTLDIAVNNAGVELETGANLGAWDSDIMRRVWQINVMGIFHCMQHEIPIMQKQGRGAIVNMSSVAGVAGAGGKPAYTASKHAVVGLTKAAAVQYGPEGIRVNAVCPSVTRTGMFDVQDIAEEVMIQAHPLRRIGDPSDVADAVLWLSSDKSRNVTGHTLLLDGGYMAY